MSGLRTSLSAVVVGLLAVVAVLASGGAAARSAATADGGSGLVEVVVTLPRAPLALAIGRDRVLASAVRARSGLDLRAPAAVSYLRTLATAQRAFQVRLDAALPDARVYWHYDMALNGVSVVLPRSQVSRLAAIPGATVWPTVTYHALRDTRSTASGATKLNVTPGLIGATQLWGSDLATAGQGMKIAILDDGIDQTHPFFNPAGFSYPPGFPKGNTAYTTPKVIVARSFPSPSTTWKYAARPFDPTYSDHATHVAGIAAGDHDTMTTVRGDAPVSGIAPKAYLGNYKVLTVPTKDYGLDGNAPEIAAGIDQAVADGMNVINLSLGEPEVAPSRDVVVTALDNAAAMGVVSAVAAGNDYIEAGHGSVGSPANAPDVISVAASTEGSGGPADDIASFSSAGPTPISLLLKPDVTAPGEDILSSIPRKDGLWAAWSGTSMATPHVAGAAALLLQRHPTWTPEQVKSALESTGDPVHPANETTETSPLREGGGRIDLVRADSPLVFTDPTSLSWGLVRRGDAETKQLVVSDGGGGLDPWSVSIATRSAPEGVTLSPSAGTVVPGTTLGITLTVSATAAEGDATGFVELTRGTDVRRIPFWLRVEIPQLGLDPHTTLTGPGLYHGDTAGKASRVSSYRYPDRGVASQVATHLTGPEQVFRFTLRKQVANFGVVVLAPSPGVAVAPRIVHAGDENRLVGYAGLPTTLNPYVGEPKAYPVVGAILPTPGAYDIVFDTPATGKPGKFLFRLWVNDTTPPSVRLLSSTVKRGTPIRLAVRDAGSGVDPGSLVAKLRGTEVPFTYAHGVVSLATATLPPGKRRVALTVSDYQETKNMEDVGPVRPNTTVFHALVTVKP